MIHYTFSLSRNASRSSISRSTSALAVSRSRSKRSSIVCKTFTLKCQIANQIYLYILFTNHKYIPLSCWYFRRISVNQIYRYKYEQVCTIYKEHMSVSADPCKFSVVLLGSLFDKTGLPFLVALCLKLVPYRLIHVSIHIFVSINQPT